MRNASLLVFAVLFIQLGFSQKKFYETSWTTNGTRYTGLLIYNNDNDAFMRVKYLNNGVSKVAEFKCYKVLLNNDGIQGYYWDGRNAKLVKGTGTGYNADNFYFIDKGGYYSSPMHIDDYGLEQNNKADYYTKVNYWKEIQPSVFTNTYVSSFFRSYESYYDKLIMLKLTSGTGSVTTAGPKTTNTTTNNSTLSTINTSNKPKSKTLSEDSGLGSIYNYSAGTYKEKWIIRSLFPKSDVNKLWDDGYDLNSIVYGNNKWILDFTKKKKTSRQRWFTRKDFPQDDIKKGWDDGFTIASITHGNGVWAVMMSKDTGYYSQGWKTRDNYPREEIDKEWKNGKAITELAYSDGKWVLVMSKGTGMYAQSTHRLATFPKDEIQKGWDNGKQITSLTYGNGKWILVMSKGSKLSTQRWRTRVDFPKKEIEEGWKNGFEVTSLAFNDNAKLWGLVMSKIK